MPASPSAPLEGLLPTQRQFRRWLRPFFAVVLFAAVLAAPLPAQAAEVGIPGPSYAGTKDPTAEKPQSKLWFNDGIWWASMFTPSIKAFTIHRLDWSSQTWRDTGVPIDYRTKAKMDVLWDGSKLYVASAGPSSTSSADSARLYRFSYNASTQTYARDVGYPAVVVNGGMEAVVLDRDSTGTVWITYTRNSTVYVTHSNGSDASWAAPYPLPVPGASTLTPDDISSTVAFDGKLGVMWGNQNEDAYYFAVHVDGAPDTAWTREIAYTRPQGADDHISIKSVQNDPEGRVFAVVKTSLTGTDDPLNVVLVRKLGGQWDTDNVYGRTQEDETRAILVLDRQNNDVYAFAATPADGGGTVYMKKTSVNGLLNGNPFSNGPGQVFMEGASLPGINNPTATKQTVNNDTDLVVLASDGVSERYVHNTIDIGPAPAPSAPQTSIDTGPSGTVTQTDATFSFSASVAGATFECTLDGGPYSACTSPRQITGLTNGSHTFSVRATSGGLTDATPDSRTWTIESTAPPTPGPAVTIRTVPIADATVRAATPNVNEGTSRSLDADTSPNEQAFARFDVTGVPNGAGVTRAVLRMRVTNATRNGPGVFPTASTWSENAITWNNRPALTGPLAADVDRVRVGDWVEYDVSRLVSGNGSFSFGLLPDVADGVAFSSREGADSPELVLQTGATGPTPSPTPPADTTAPQTTITAGPSGSVASPTASFGFVADEAGATFGCRLDAGPWAPCTSPATLSGLAAGDHTFAVRATDAAGNTDTSPASRTWTVTQTAPAQTSVTRFGAAQDARVASASPATNYGAATSLVADGSPATRSLLSFDVRGLSGAVQTARLRLYVTNGTSNGPTVQPVTSPWTENDVTWATQPTTSSTVLANVGSASAGGWLDLDVTSAVTGNGTVDLALLPESTNGMDVSSREASTNPPELVVTTAP